MNKLLTFFLLVCCLASTRLYAQIPAAPGITGATTICTGNGTTLTATGEPGATFRWWDAPAGGNLKSTTAAYSIPVQNTAGTYHWYVEQTANGFTSVRTDVVVTVNQVPTVSMLPANPSVSCPGNNIVLTASGATTYVWSPGGTTGNTRSVNPTVNTSYTVTGTTNGCSASASQMVTVNGKTTASADVTICYGDSTTLSASGGAVTYTWNPGGLTGSSVKVAPTATTTYVVSGTGPGCLTADTVVVTVRASIGLTTGSATTVPEGTIVNLTCSSVLPATYVWTPNHGNSGTLSGNSVWVVPTQTTTYIATATDGFGCTAKAPQLVTLSKLAAISGNTAICSGAATTLTASGTGPFTWYDAATSGNLLFTGAGYNTGNLGASRSFWVSDNGGARKEVRVVVPGTQFSVSAAPLLLCGNDTSRLRAVYPEGVVKWYDAPTGGNLVGTTSGNSSLSVSPATTTTYYAESVSAPVTLSFNYTGAVQTWTVPAGVTSINIDAYGSAGDVCPSPYSKIPNSKGGRVQATMNVTPGQVLNIYVGGKNNFNGGGYPPWGYTTSGSKGGDATDIRINGTALIDRVLVAGGGGGTGHYSVNAAGWGIASPGLGHGGGLIGQDGGSYNGGPLEHGRGGAQNSGGSPGDFPGVGSGYPGSFGEGGRASGSSGHGGGGGGGGWYGGGGGIVNGDGGGGSSYTNPILCYNVIHTQGVWDNLGVLFISYGTSCTAATRIPVTITVNPMPVVSLSGSPCSGDSLTLTTSLVPGQIQWKSGSVIQRTDRATWNANATNVTSGGSSSSPAQLSGPGSVFVDITGNLYAVDVNNNRVVKWAPGVALGTVVAGGNGAGSNLNQLNNPSGVYVDAAKNVYVADQFNHRIQKWAPGATQGTTVAGISGNGGPAADQLYYPANVTMDALGNLYVADLSNHRVQKWAPNATQGTTVAGKSNGAFGAGADVLYLPGAVKVDSARNVFVLEQGNARVSKWAPDSTHGVTVATGLSSANGFEMDGAGNLYIPYLNNGVERRAPGAGSGTVVAGNGAIGNGANQLYDPYGIALDAAGNLYVADRGNNRVQKFTLSNNTPLSPPTAAGNYTAVVTSLAGCTATTPVKTITQSAVISAQPVATGTVCSTNPIVLSVTATGATGYQWQRNGTNISGATTAVFNKANSAAGDAGTYKVIVIGTSGCNDTSTNSTVNITAMSNSLPTANVTAGYIHTDGLEYGYADASCRPIAGIADAAGGNVLGNVSATLVLDGSVQTSQGRPYLQRHYDLQPAGNGAATVRLYALQSEFDAYNNYITTNALAWPKLPAGPSDVTGKANISVSQYHGTPASGTTGPGGQYNAGQSELIPNSQITTTWNGNYWTLSFPVSGFSGFFITTGTGTVLAVDLKSVSARNIGTRNEVLWQTAKEDAGDYFEIERSFDAQQFAKIGTTQGRFVQGGSYVFTDEYPATGINYYRLKMVDAAGRSSYSKTVQAVVQKDGVIAVEAYPNPAREALTVKVHGAVSAGAIVRITDVSGKLLRSVPVQDNETVIPMRDLAAGIYLLHYHDEAHSQSFRVTKQ